MNKKQEYPIIEEVFNEITGELVCFRVEYEDRIEYVPLDPRNGDLARVRAKWESMEEKPFEIDWDSIYLADKLAVADLEAELDKIGNEDAEKTYRQ